MGFFVRKRIKVAPGVKVNLGLKQASVTIGGHGVGVNVPIGGRGRKQKAEPQDDSPRRPSSTLAKLIALSLLGFIGWCVLSYVMTPAAPKPIPAQKNTAPVEASPPPVAVTQQEPATIETPKAEPVTQNNREAEAARKLALVKPFLDRGDDATAKKRLKEIVDKFQGTTAATEAAEQLKKFAAK